MSLLKKQRAAEYSVTRFRSNRPPPQLCTPPSFPPSLSVRLSNFFEASVSEELNKTAVKPSRRERRWQVKSFFSCLFFIFFSFFLHSGFKTPTLALSSRWYFVRTKWGSGRGEGAGSCLWQVGSCYYQSEMTIKRPLTLPVLPVAFTVPVTG